MEHQNYVMRHFSSAFSGSYDMDIISLRFSNIMADIAETRECCGQIYKADT